MERYSQTVLTNMCMISNGDYILVEDKQHGNYRGVTFPGGHIEDGESLADAVIREVHEETGLVIKNPKLCGVYDWMTKEHVRYMVFIYKADVFNGEIQSSDEGQVRWILKKDFLKEKLAHGMDKVFEIIEDSRFSECFYDMKIHVEFMK